MVICVGLALPPDVFKYSLVHYVPFLVQENIATEYIILAEALIF